MRRTRTTRATLTALTAIAISLVMVTQASAGPSYYGASVGTWGARWWGWAFSIPADEHHPLFDSEGDDCGRQQPSKRFVYLVGVFNDSGDVVRHDCVVPKGRGIFFPVVNVECSSLEPEPFFGDDPQSLAACLDRWSFRDTFATLDGDPITTRSERSGMVQIGPMPETNLLGAAEGATGVSMADGLYGILPPLPPGSYELHFGGEYVLDGEPLGFDLDITYHLTVR